MPLLFKHNICEILIIKQLYYFSHTCDNRLYIIIIVINKGRISILFKEISELLVKLVYHNNLVFVFESIPRDNNDIQPVCLRLYFINFQ